ncbi:MAG TPA: hypothetical protein VI756_24355 [Blastocatellia bacterium]
MIIEFDLQSRLLKCGLAAVAVIVFAAMIMAGLHRFVVGTLADERIDCEEAAGGWQAPEIARVDSGTLEEGVDNYPYSGRLQRRVAEAEMFGGAKIPESEHHALQAIALSPHDYRLRELLASIRESEGDRAEAENSLREAARLAPNYVDVHWRLANLLLREGKAGESVSEFKRAVFRNPALLPITLALVWRSTDGSLDNLLPLAQDDQEKIELADFLLKHHRAADAARVFDDADRMAWLASSKTSDFLNNLLSDGDFQLAKQLWAGVVGADWPQVRDSIVWNGGFESDILLNFPQFDWAIKPSPYARISIDTGTVHQGSRSLLIDFAGRDTTKLDGEIQQLILVKPGRRYRVEWFCKTERLVTPKGPQIEITGPKGAAAITQSDPVAPGSSEWRHMQVDFTAPSMFTAPGMMTDTVKLYLRIVRRPDFSYDDPTQGLVWFDDFSAVEFEKSK